MREFGKKRPNSAIDFCWILIVSPCIYRGIVSLIINDENRSIDLSIWPSIEVCEPLFKVLKYALVLFDYNKNWNLESVQAKSEGIEQALVEVAEARGKNSGSLTSVDQANTDGTASANLRKLP